MRRPSKVALVQKLWLVLITRSNIHRNTFGLIQMKWQFSLTCYICQVAVQNYCILSPFLLGFLSLQRLVITSFPMNKRMQNKDLVGACMATLWLISVSYSIAITVTQPQNNNFCFPLATPSKNSIMKANTFFIAILQLIGAIVIVFSYGFTYFYVHNSRKKMDMNKSKIMKGRSHSKLFMHLLILIGSCLLCWVTSSVIYISILFMARYPLSMIVWILASVIPINAFTNSIMFTRNLLK